LSFSGLPQAFSAVLAWLIHLGVHPGEVQQSFSHLQGPVPGALSSLWYFLEVG
jgi:hypothetical protein